LLRKFEVARMLFTQKGWIFASSYQKNLFRRGQYSFLPCNPFYRVIPKPQSMIVDESNQF
jgi:hypothetical protein